MSILLTGILYTDFLMELIAKHSPQITTHSSISKCRTFLPFPDVCSGLMLSAAHNVLFFVLDLRTPVLHFLHFASTLCFLLVKSVLQLLPDQPTAVGHLLIALTRPPLRTIFLPPVAAQLLVCLLSANVHAQNRTGGLYLIRQVAN